MKTVFGLGQSSGIVVNQVIAGTTPLVSPVQLLEDLDDVSVAFVFAPSTRTVVVTNTDNVVASTHTWVFANGAFVAGDVGGTITVAGATNSNNNATVTIASVTNSTTIVTGGTQTNETFNNGTTTLVVTKPLVQVGASGITAAVSNDYSEDTGNNALPNAGHFGDASSLFTPAFGAITTSGTKYAQAQIVGRAIQFTVTPTSGQSLLSIFYFAKQRGK